MIKGKWRPSPNGQARRYYYITDEGRKRLASMLQEWTKFTKAVNLVAHPEDV